MNKTKIKMLAIEMNRLEVEFNQKYNVLKDELDKETKIFQKICSHKRTQIRNQSFFEEGHMSSPITWKEAYCVDCGKVIAKTMKVETWVDVYEEDDEA